MVELMRQGRSQTRARSCTRIMERMPTADLQVGVRGERRSGAHATAVQPPSPRRTAGA